MPGGSQPLSQHVTQPLVLADMWQGWTQELAHGGESGGSTEIPPVGADAFFRVFSVLPIPDTAKPAVKRGLVGWNISSLH